MAAGPDGRTRSGGGTELRLLSLAAFAAAYLLAWWVLSSAASRRHGAIVFVVGLALFWAGMRAYRRGRPERLLRLGYLSLLCAAAALLVEAALHVRPSLFGGRVANFAYTGYHPYRAVIYAYDPSIGSAMRPGVRRWIYWNGHWWHHRSNAQGWRGPALLRADVVFLGDSMIHGHGVQEEETVPARFARRTSLATANLGQQGTCAVQQLVLMRRHGRALRPRVVFLCAHPTDMEDVIRMYDRYELQRMVDHPDQDPLIRSEYRPPRGWSPLWLWGRYVELPMWSGGILGTLLRTMRERGAAPPALSRDPFVPTPAEIAEDLPIHRPGAPGADTLAWQAHRASVQELGRECDRLGARLVLFDLGYPRSFSEATEALARELGAEYSPAGRVALRRALAGEPVYLANDGHWTAHGADVVAEALAQAAAVRDIVRD